MRVELAQDFPVPDRDGIQPPPWSGKSLRHAPEEEKRMPGSGTGQAAPGRQEKNAGQRSGTGRVRKAGEECRAAERDRPRPRGRRYMTGGGTRLRDEERR